jgi:hypothetical protein
MANPTVYVEPPVRAPRRGGIKTVAEFIANNRIASGATLEYTSAGCDFPVDDIALCYPLGGDPQDPKVPVGIDTLDGNGPVFGLYAGVQCTLDPDNDFDERARATLDQGEDRGIEKRLNDWAALVTPTATVTGGNLKEALARAEQEADTEYLGAPVILLNRGDLVRLDGSSIDREGDTLYTKNGTRILSSSKITANTVTAVGALAVYESPVIVNRVVAHTTNAELAIAERVYAILVDCGYAARYLVTA